MSKEQVSISDLLHSLDSSELQEAEQVRATVNQQLSSGENRVNACAATLGFISAVSPKDLL